MPDDAAILAFRAGAEWPESLASHGLLLEEVLRAGSIPDNRYGAAMQILAAILQHDPGMPEDVQRMRTAVAIALEFPHDYVRMDSARAIGRYDWYCEARESGRLLPSFDQLETWERRMAVNLPWHHGDGSPDGLDWLNREVKLPEQEYVGACWQAPYRDANPFGESVQGPLYYTPWQETHQAYLLRREIGAVCGGLSHYGAAAARANGLPAVTMGEPGHCAYAVRLEGKWVPAYSLDDDRNPHQGLLGNHWPYLVLQETVFRDPQRNLQTARRLGAALLVAERDLPQALQWVREACQDHPEHPEAWRIALELVARSDEADWKNWWTLAGSLGKGLAGYPLVAMETLATLDTNRAPLNQPPLRGRMVAACLKAAMGEQAPESPPMNWRRMFDQAYRFAGGTPEDQQQLAEAIVQQTVRGPHAQQVLDDLLQRFSGVLEWQDRMLDQFASELSRQKGPGKGEARTGLIERCIRAAAERRDCDSFQKFARLHPAPVRGELKPPQPAFPGKLVSAKGSVRMSSTSQWDSIAGHAAVLQTSGGAFHTGKDEGAWVEVTLPKLARLNGIVIDNHEGGNSGRAVPLEVSISTDGTEWKTVFSSSEDLPQWRVDLTEERPTARWIRIRGGVGRREFLHLRRILVYGTPQA